MNTLNLLIMTGFVATCTSFGGVLLVNRAHMNVIPTAALAMVGIVISAAWAWMMSILNAKVVSNISLSVSRSKEDRAFQILIGLNFLLVVLGSTIAWTLIPVLKMIHVFV